MLHRGLSDVGCRLQRYGKPHGLERIKSDGMKATPYHTVGANLADKVLWTEHNPNCGELPSGNTAHFTVAFTIASRLTPPAKKLLVIDCTVFASARRQAFNIHKFPTSVGCLLKSGLRLPAVEKISGIGLLDKKSDVQTAADGGVQAAHRQNGAKTDGTNRTANAALQ